MSVCGNAGVEVVQMGSPDNQTIPAFPGRPHGVPSIDLARFDVDPAITSLVRPDVAWKYGFVPLCRTAASLTIATADPANVSALDEIKFMTGYSVEPVAASAAAVAAAIARYYPASQLPAFFRPGGPTTPSTIETASRGLEELETALDQGGQVELLDELREIRPDTSGSEAADAPVVRLVNLLLMSAVQKGASDIHIEPYERELRVRCRVDGILQTMTTPPLAYRDAIASRVKIMARLDIAEKRLPQDGRIKIRFNDNGRRKEIDFRVSVLPTLFGEKIVLRLLDRDLLMLDLARLGFEPESLARFESAIERPWGMVLVTGPTGSGKTNTLYSCIARLNTPGTNIITAEDPVEFNLAGINQVQVRDGIGLDFAAALRSFLRQDPNIILVGEIRDAETAGIAVKASLTGRLVLSTLHTSDAPSAIGRLTNMGIEPFLVASSVHMICAQRLVRRICTHCAESSPYPAAALVQAGFTATEAATVQPRKGAGCARCHSSGYKGRVGLYEVMVVSDALRELVLAGAPAIELRRQAVAEGMITLRRSGLRKVIDGVTTLEEVVRETVH